MSAGRHGGGAVRDRPRAPRSPEHPAIRERRRQVAREEGRRRRSRALWLLGALAGAALAYWVLTGPLLSVSGVSVRGYDRDDRAQLIGALSAAAKRGTVMSPAVADMERAAARNPWVDSISVARKWPRALAVDVVQARPAAVAFADGADPVLVNADGRVLDVAGDAGGRLGWIRLDEAPPAPGGHLPAASAAAVEFLRHLEPDIAARVRDLAPGEGGVLGGRLDAGPELRLGKSERLPAKATALGMVLDALSVTDRAAATYIDLSVPEHPAVGGLAPDDGTVVDDGTDADADATAVTADATADAAGFAED